MRWAQPRASTEWALRQWLPSGPYPHVLEDSSPTRCGSTSAVTGRLSANAAARRNRIWLRTQNISPPRPRASSCRHIESTGRENLASPRVGLPVSRALTFARCQCALVAGWPPVSAHSRLGSCQWKTCKTHLIDTSAPSPLTRIFTPELLNLHCLYFKTFRGGWEENDSGSLIRICQLTWFKIRPTLTTNALPPLLPPHALKKKNLNKQTEQQTNN